MATRKSALLTSIDSGILAEGRQVCANVKTGLDYISIVTGDLDAGDIIHTGIVIPSSAIMLDIKILNADLDTNGTPTLTADFGLFALDKFTSTTSKVKTIHASRSEIDADLFVDGTTELQSANTNFVSLEPDATTFGSDDRIKRIWELLGYDYDPQTRFILGITFPTGAATASAGDLIVRAEWLANN